MPKNSPRMTSKTGNARIVKQGHTTDGNYGSDPNLRGKGQKPVRELSPK